MVRQMALAWVTMLARAMETVMASAWRSDLYWLLSQCRVGWDQEREWPQT
jgi:hypothetical protein